MKDKIKPGLCPVDCDGVPICPPPSEIDIIRVTKVFQECMHTQVEIVDVYDNSAAPLPNTADVSEIKCQRSRIVDVDCEKVGGKRVRVSFKLRVRARYRDDNGDAQVVNYLTDTISKTFRVSRADERDLDAFCHIFPECLDCFIAERDPCTQNITKITCCIGVLILIKLEAEVQLMVPCYGFPPQPPECDQIIGECPTEYVPTWPPYPVQTGAFNQDNDNDNDNGNLGCYK
ncbi:hypothetical protein SAMN00017405_2081 [Desulfonispora thiosulfatigenes DSM 11270]|uniref:SipL SPOCS domain-containing protein n=1 Tax=Desulfonispora thiosulfatigenes DSM 11270 TaxID=656914 RepID=A0A1W1VHE8_DESTI|nr:hypothetical protein [Desulfonispora thiosulfatigenes]SMB92673.1 hypothetical protein SAMN00017405_2081 [Desulfonispora thiosulfatigenes DSM 11270]